MSVIVEALLAELNCLQGQIKALTTKLAQVTQPQEVVNALSNEQCKRIQDAIDSLGSSVKPLVAPASNTLVHAIKKRKFYIDEANFWLAVVNHLVHKFIDFDQFENEMVTLKSSNPCMQIEPSMITEITLAIREEYEYDDNGGTFAIRQITGKSVINWNVPEMHPLIHLHFEFHTDDEESVNALIDAILDELNQEVIYHITQKYEIDELIDIEAWSARQSQLDSITIPVEEPLLHH